MAITQDTYNGNGSNLGPFSFTFKWLESTDIKVSVGGVLKTAGTHYNLQNLNYNPLTGKTGGEVLFTAGNAPPVGTNNIRIYRDTDDEALSAVFSSGSAIRAKDLNDNFTQNLYVTQEVNNNALNVDGSNPMVGPLNMNGFQITNLPVPAVDTNAATKKYVDDRFGNLDVPGHTRWRKVATNGQTTFSGTGDYGGVLAYSPTREQVYINGALQQRGVDYAADNGTSVVFTVGLTVGDVVDIICINNLTNSAISNAANINYSGQFSGQTARTVAAKLGEVVSVLDFGADPTGQTDSTAAIQALINRGTNQTIRFPAGTYLISSLTIPHRNTTLLFDGCTLLGKATGSYTHLIRNNSQFTTFTGHVTIDTQFNAGYDCALWITAGYGKYHNITFLKTKLCIQFGTPNVNQVSLSETLFDGILTNQCGRAADLHGIFTVAQFTNSTLVGGEAVEWAGIDFSTIRTYGAQFFFSNGQLHGAPSNTYPIIYGSQILHNGDYWDPSVHISNLDCEAYRPFIQVWNIANVDSIVNRGKVLIENSRIDFYYSQLPNPASQPAAFFFNNHYNGMFKTVNNHFWFDTALLARPAIIGAKTKADISFSDFPRNGQFYGDNVIQPASTVPSFGLRSICSVYRNAALNVGSPTTVVFDTKDIGVQGQRFLFNDFYSTTTGIFTVPPGGLHSVMVNWQWKADAVTDGTAWIKVYRSGALTTHLYGRSGGLKTGNNMTVLIGELAENDTIECVIYTNLGGSTPLDVASKTFNRMEIFALGQVPNT